MKNPKVGDRVRVYGESGRHDGEITATRESKNNLKWRVEFDGASMKYSGWFHHSHLIRLVRKPKSPRLECWVNWYDDEGPRCVFACYQSVEQADASRKAPGRTVHMVEKREGKCK